MDAYVLATQGATESATMISTVLNRNNSVPARKGLSTSLMSSLGQCWLIVN